MMKYSNIKYSGVITNDQLDTLCDDLNTSIKTWLNGWNPKLKLSTSVLKRNMNLFSDDNLKIEENINCINGLIFHKKIKNEFFEKIIMQFLKLTDKNVLNDHDSSLIKKLNGDCSKTFYMAILGIVEKGSNEGLNVPLKVNDVVTTVLSLNVCIDDFEFELYFSDSFVKKYIMLNQSSSNINDTKAINTESIINEIKLEELTCGVSLQAAPISIKQLTSLSVGHILKIEQPIDNPMVVNINNKPAFLGYLVKSDGEKSIYLSGDYNE